jgi:hypothetical protein
MIPSTSKGNKQFFAFARIFSGRVEPGQKIYVCGPNFVPSTRDDVIEVKITGVYLMMAARQKAVGWSIHYCSLVWLDVVQNMPRLGRLLGCSAWTSTCPRAALSFQTSTRTHSAS